MNSTFNQDIASYFSTIDTKPQNEVAAVRSCCAWLHHNSDEWDNVALYDIERLASENDFRVCEYLGSKLLSEKELWKPLFNLWIDWLRDMRDTNRSVKWEPVFNRNISKLESALETPSTLKEDPYVFIGNSPGTTLMTHTNENFALRFYFDNAYDQPPLLRASNKEEETKRYNAGGVIGLADMNTRDTWEYVEEQQIALFNDFTYTTYKPTPPEFLLHIADEALFEYKHLTPNDRDFWFWIPKAASIDFPEELSDDEMLTAQLMELTHKGESAIKKAVRSFSKSVFAGGFPEVPDGGEVTETFFTKLGEESGLERIARLATIPYEIYSSRLSRLTSGVGYNVGGLGTTYIMLEHKPEEMYEYIGDEMMRVTRKMFHESTNEDPKEVEGFFGWIGRHLMKKYHPETVLSLDTHVELSKREKEEMREGLTAEIKRASLQAFKAFKEKETDKLITTWGDEPEGLNDDEMAALKFAGRFHRPTFMEMETPLKYHLYEVADRIFGWDYGFGFFRESKEEYLKYKEQATEGLNDEQILHNWLNEKRRTFISRMKLLKLKTKHFEDFWTYFSFVRDEELREGYFLAQKHLDEALEDIGATIQMPARELQERFMQGDVPFYNYHDYQDSYPDIDMI